MVDTTHLLGESLVQVVPELRVEEENDRYARIVIEPLQAGYGITLGNSLRRVLLSSLPGAAITSVRIDQVQHEFSVIPGMVEDATEFLLNVKEINIRALSDRPGTLTLDVQGPCEVRAGDIQCPADFEIVNPELHLATLDSPEASLNVEFHVQLGTGYVPATSAEGLPIGVIPVDTIFSPIRKANFKVERTRVGQSTNFDRLILEVWANGTIDPVEAVAQAAEILIEQFSLFANFGRPYAAHGARPVGTSAILSPDRYNTPIEELNLSVRAYNCLKRSGLMTVGQVLEKSEEELLSLRNFGRKSYDELRERLAELGFIDPNQPGLQPIAERPGQRRRPATVRTSSIILDEDDEESISVLGKALKEALKEAGDEELLGADDEE